MTMTFVDVLVIILLPRLVLSDTDHRWRQDAVVVEKSPPGTVVCNVKELALTLAPDNKTRVNKHLLRFRIKTSASSATSSGNGSKYSGEDFKINETTGELATKRFLNRDLLCPGLELCIARLDVQVTPVEYYQVIGINITLLDINDHAPTFPSNESRIFLSTNSRKGQLLQLPFALDPDEGRNGSVWYELLGVGNDTLHDLDGFLSLEMRSCEGNQPCPILKVTRDFNSSFSMERLSSHFLLLATDRGIRPLSGSTVVTLKFIHSPPEAWLAFETTSYSVSVQENKEAELALIEVNAVPLNRYPSAADLMTISYSLVKMEDGNCSDAFHIDSSTGIVTSITLDYETFQSCSFQVKASLFLPQTTSAISAAMAAAASEAAATPATTIVVVYVGNINDHAPTIELTTSGSTVKAGSPEGTLVAQLVAGDLDDLSAGMNDSVNCTVDSSFRLFQLQQTPLPLHYHQYDLVTSSIFPLQKFSSSFLSVSIFCSDSGGIITKRLLGVNIIRRAPSFRNGSLLLSLESNQLEPGQVLVERLDIIPGDSDVTVFSVKAHDERNRGMLEITPQSIGELIISGSYRGDFKAGLYGFNVTVADAADSNLNDTVVFQLVVESTNTIYPSTPFIQVNSRTASNTQLLVSTSVSIDINNKNTSITNNDYINNNHYSSYSNNNNRTNTDYPKVFLSGNATTPSMATPSNNSVDSSTLINNDDKNIIIIITAIACGTLVLIIIIIAAVIVLISKYKIRKGLTALPSAHGSTISPLRPIPPRSNHAEDEGMTISGDVSPATVEIRDEESLKSVTDSGKGQSGEEEVNFSSGSNLAGEFIQTHKYYVYHPLTPLSDFHQINRLDSCSTPGKIPHIHPSSLSLSDRKNRSKIKVGTGLQSIYNVPDYLKSNSINPNDSGDGQTNPNFRPVPKRRGTVPHPQKSPLSPVYHDLYSQPVIIKKQIIPQSSRSNVPCTFKTDVTRQNNLDNAMKDSFV